mmetsp:Transcript_4442/g.6087  ORF Transcript_4442/g.6087 Transcript_4442/m.6087 type:complete len:159 (-) Transcript_4442:542-1018(-)
MAAEHGKLEVPTALLVNDACDSNLKDLNDQTPIHSVICSIEQAADRCDNKKVDDLVEVLKVFLAKRPDAFHVKGSKKDITGIELGRNCKVKKVQELLRGTDIILSAIHQRKEFNVDDFNHLWQGSKKKKLEEAIFNLLEEWAFDPSSRIEDHRGYLQE